MKGWKNLAVIAILLAIIAGAVTFGVKRLMGGGARPPQWYLQRPIEKIDSESFELVTKTYGEWRKLGQKDGKFKNPNTGAYTMVPMIICASCGEKIPAVVLPPLPKSATKEQQEAHMSEVLEAMRAYKCPKCGGPAYRPDLRPVF